MITPKTGSQTEIPDNAWKTISKKFSQQNQQPGSRVSLSKKVFLNIEESENNSTHHPRLAVLATSIKYFHFKKSAIFQMDNYDYIYNLSEVFFFMWTTLKVFIEFVAILFLFYVLVFFSTRDVGS